MSTPREELWHIVDKLDAVDEADEHAIATIGVGALENLLRDHEATLWDQIEILAKSNTKFRRALKGVWAYDSPMFERRKELLNELTD